MIRGGNLFAVRDDGAKQSPIPRAAGLAYVRTAFRYEALPRKKESRLLGGCFDLIQGKN
jgi:hypothetical protein